MLVIAERINATRRRIARAFAERDANAIAHEARIQAAAGADFIDVNAGSVPEKEVENLAWAVGIVQQAVDKPICLDSANPEALRAGLKAVTGKVVMINSVTAEAKKMEEVMPIAAGAGAMLVALTMDERGLPTTAARRMEITARLVVAAEDAGIPLDRLYIDPCIQPISTSPEQAQAVLVAVREIMKEWRGIHTTGGLSNISFGLPNRALLNRLYISALIMEGYDSAIIDPTADGMMESIRAAEALAGRDEYCMKYIRAMRAAKA